MSEMAVMGAQGDSRVTWSKENADEVDAARDQFNTLTGRGFSAFAVNAQGEATTRMKAFDEDAEKVVLVPPMAGG